jgi:hypothetical protein
MCFGMVIMPLTLIGETEDEMIIMPPREIMPASFLFSFTTGRIAKAKSRIIARAFVASSSP